MTLSFRAATTLLFAASLAATAQTPQLNLMPLPAHVQQSTGAFALHGNLSVAVTGETPRLRAAVDRTLQRMGTTAKPSDHAELTITVSWPALASEVDTDESYRLNVTPSGITLQAATDLGALHGLETLVQLAHGNSIPAVTIDDRPRFGWRGLLIDCSRHYEPIDVLKRNLDAMAAVKLNVFHWHLVDDQGFRIESKRFPKLQTLGTDGHFYTQAEARELVAYAHARGIRVVPEFEMPGHSSAWLMAYPELNSGSQPTEIRRQFGVSPYVLDPTRDATYTFIASFLEEMATIFPDPYVHIGGDEAPAPDWKTNPRILAFKKEHNLADNGALQAYFNQRVLKILAGLHKRMVGWDEILNPALPKDVVVQSWRGIKSLTTGAQEGYQGILSAPYYLDHMDSTAKYYLADPLPADSVLTPAQRKLILGGEITMWAEFVDPNLLDSRIWPRAAAIAERFWSPEDVRDVDSMYRRLDTVSAELESFGLTQRTHQPTALRALAGSIDPALLDTFANAFEPAPFGEHVHGGQATTQTPLNGFVDALTPDPPVEHRLNASALIVAANPRSGAPEARAFLEKFFQDESRAAATIAPQLANNPSLAALQPHAAMLASLSQVGLDALRYTRGGHAPAGWKAKSLAAIQAARRPGAFVHFDFLDALTTLVDDAAKP